MTQPRPDDGIEGLAELTALYRDGRGAGSPADLDASIRAAARGDAPTRRRRWQPTLALAASLMLGIGLIGLMSRQVPPPADESASFKSGSPATLEAESPAPEPAAVADPAERRATAGQDRQYPTPEAWRARIAELQRQGRNDEAASELAAFRRVYPDRAAPEAEPASP